MTDQQRINEALDKFKNKLKFKTKEAADQYGKDQFTKWCTTTTLGCKVIKWSQNKHKCWDVAYTLGNVNVVGEIKFRDAYSTTYDGWVYEQKRHDKLLAVKTNETTQIHYINFYQDKVMNIWNVTNVHNEKETVQRKMKASEYDGPQMELKTVYELKNEETIITTNLNQ